MPAENKCKNVVLLVDDEPSVLMFASYVLAHAGFSVHTEPDGEEGLRWFQTHRSEVCLVVTDILMPKMNGLDMAFAICTIDPDVPIMLVSGYSDQPLEAKARAMFPFLRKPFLAEDLLRCVRREIAKPVDSRSDLATDEHG